MSGMLHQTIWI